MNEVLLQVECPSVIFTRFHDDRMGHAIARVVHQLERAQINAGIHGYTYSDSLKGYFDDSDHARSLESKTKLHCRICKPRRGEGRREFKSTAALQSHLATQHGRHFCPLCLKHRMCFFSEHKLYSEEELEKHLNGTKSKQDRPFGEDEGFKGHPWCLFCQEPFFGENELYRHMRTEHYQCHICEEDNHQYWKDYDELESHFRDEHFLCEHQECKEAKFVVFRTMQELRDHRRSHDSYGGAQQRPASSAPQLSARNTNADFPSLTPGSSIAASGGSNWAQTAQAPRQLSSTEEDFPSLRRNNRNSGRRRRSSGRGNSGNAPAPRGAWAGRGGQELAHRINVINETWGSRR